MVWVVTRVTKVWVETMVTQVVWLETRVTQVVWVVKLETHRRATGKAGGRKWWFELPRQPE